MEKNQTAKSKVMLTILGAWLLTITTLVASVQVIRQQVVVNTARPAYAVADVGGNLWNRNDNENETVHMPTEFDIGLRSAAISGKK